jgi:hypothetical protein
MAQKMKRIDQELGTHYEAVAHERIGTFDCLSREDYKEGIKHLQKVRDIFVSTGNTSGAQIVESNIANVKLHHEGRGRKSSKEEFKNALRRDRDMYENSVRSEGECSMNAMGNGLNMVKSLSDLGRAIECEKLASKLAALSLRVYGSEHDVAKRASRALETNKRRHVAVISLGPDPPGVGLEALRYEAVGDKYIVRAFKRDGNVTIGDTFIVASNDIICGYGTPVVCHSLKNATHLNGKIGDAKEYNNRTGRCEVHFEDKNLKPKPVSVAVKRENLRILFELPAAAVGDEIEATSTAEKNCHQ